MEAPVAAPRGSKLNLGARAKIPRPPTEVKNGIGPPREANNGKGPPSEGSPSMPQAPLRRKKKFAPTAPSSTSNLLGPSNSTMYSSTLSLATMEEMSPIRPASSLTSLNRVTKKRRAPPPPVPVVKSVMEESANLVIKEENIKVDAEKSSDDSYIKVNMSKTAETSDNAITEPDRTIKVHLESKGTIKEKEILDQVSNAVSVKDGEISDAGLEEIRSDKREKKKKKKKDKDRDRSADDGEGHKKKKKHKHKSHTDERKDADDEKKHRKHKKDKENGAVTNTEAVRTDIDEEKVEERYSPIMITMEEGHIDVIDVEIPPSSFPSAPLQQNENLKDSHPEEIEDKHNINLPDARVEETLNMRGRNLRDVQTYTTSPETINTGSIDFVHHEDLNDVHPKDSEEFNSDTPPIVNVDKEERRKKKEKKKRRKEEEKERLNQSVTDPTELPSFRGARAVEVHRMSRKEEEGMDEGEDGDVRSRKSSLGVETSKSDSDDSLVNSDDELVNLFSSQGVKMAERQGDSVHSSGPGHQDTDSEKQTRQKPRKITGKEREDKRKEEIILEQRQGRQGEEAVDQIGSESLRLQLKQLGLSGGEVETTVPAYKREWKAVELDIEEDDILLPDSIKSSRSNSLLEVTSEEESKDTEDRQFALKELEKEVSKSKQMIHEERRTVNPEISRALDESFAEISLITNTNDSFVAVSDTMVVEARNNSPLLCEATNPSLVSEESRQNFDFSEHEDDDASSWMPAGGEYGHGAVPERGAREDPGVTRIIEQGAPSPDSGIHDYGGENCSSPISSLGMEEVRIDKQGHNTPDSGLELQGSEVTSSEGTDVCLQDVVEEDGMVEQHNSVVEKVELPRRHTGKVLFSMASYAERSPGNRSTTEVKEVVKAESYRRVASQLNANLAAGVQRRKEEEVKTSSKQEELDRSKIGDHLEQEKKRGEIEIAKKEFETNMKKNEDEEMRRKHAENEALRKMSELKSNNQRTNELDATVPVTRTTSLGSSDPGSESAAFRSQIIEQFEERRGIVILGTGQQGGALAGAGTRREHNQSSGHQQSTGSDEGGHSVTRSLDRKVVEMPGWSHGEGGSLHRGMGQGSNPRNLVSSSHEKKGNYRGPPSISMQVWGEEPRLKGVVVKEDKDTVQGRREDRGKVSQPRAGLEEAVTTGPGTGAAYITGQYSGGSRHNVGQNSNSAVSSWQVGVGAGHNSGQQGGSMYTGQQSGSMHTGQQSGSMHAGQFSGNTLERSGKHIVGQNRTTPSEGRKSWERQIGKPNQPLPIEIRSRNGEVEVGDKQMVVVAGSKLSKGGVGEGVRGGEEQGKEPMQSVDVPQKSLSYSRGYVGARTEHFQTEVARKPFYFGMSPPDKEEVPARPTAVGKVRDNEALSQPFRTKPRHRVKGEGRDGEVREVLIVPVTNNGNNNSVTMENKNQSTPVILTSGHKVSPRPTLPPKEPAQEELNKAFQEKLSKARLRLRSSSRSEERRDDDEEGTPPPPPPPVLPGPPVKTPPPPMKVPPPPVAPVIKGPQPPIAPVIKPTLKWEKRVSTLPKGPIVNPRDELMRAIREKAGQPRKMIQL